MSYSRPKIVRAGIFELNCDMINKELCRRSNAQVERLLKTIQEQAIAANKEICAQFKVAAEKALTKPTDTDHLMSLKAFVEKFKNESLGRLDAEITQARARLDFLMDNTTFSRYITKLRNYLKRRKGAWT